jgi:hypothetical protein
VAVAAGGKPIDDRLWGGAEIGGYSTRLLLSDGGCGTTKLRWSLT